MPSLGAPRRGVTGQMCPWQPSSAGLERSQRDSSPLCASSLSIPPSIPQPDPFLLPARHGILVLSQLAGLAALGRPPLAAGRMV